MSSTNATDNSSTADTSSSGGGLMSTLGGLMRMADPTFLMSIGAGLLSGARYGSNAGEGLLQGLSMYQQQKQGQLQRQQMQQQMPLQQQLLQQQVQQGQMGLDWQKALNAARLQALPGNQGSGATPPGMPAPSTPDASQFLPGISPMPSAGGMPAVPTQQPAGAGSPPTGYWDVPTPQTVDQATFPGELMPRNLARVSAIGDPKVQDELEKSHYLAAQRAYGSQMSTLKYIAQSPNPGSVISAAPAMQAKFVEWAKAAGIDPNSTDPQDLRHVATYAYNQYAGSLGGEPLPVQNALTKEGLDPITGKYEGGEPQKIIRNGQPVNVRPQDAIGQTPYNPSILGASSITDATRDWAYQYASLHGGALPPGLSRSPASTADLMNYVATRAKQEGNTQLSMVAEQQQLKGAQGVVKDFTSGQTAKTLNGLNTAISHMDQLDQAATALQNGDVRALNKSANFFKTQFGSNATTNFSVVKNFAAGEVAKAVLPGGGGEHEREEIAEAINSSSSPEQLHSAIQTWRNLLAGKTEALRNQWDVGTNGTQGEFDKFLLPATKKALGMGSTSATSPPTQNAKGWALHRDAKGNMAYVSPNGKQFEEVR